MSRREHGSKYLADFEHDPVRIECQPCGKEWCFGKAELLAQYGDVGMPGLKDRLVACTGAPMLDTPRCFAIYAGTDGRSIERRYEEAMRRYRWISQLAAANARVWVRCTACGRQSPIMREKLRRWLARDGAARDLSIADVQRRLRCGFGSGETGEFGCGQKRAVLEWIAREDVPPPDPKLIRPKVS